MTKYEELLRETERQSINILEIDLGTKKKCGKCVTTNDGDYIVINSNISESEKYEILSEELGHFFTSYGDISNLSDIGNIKQEKRARRWSYETTVGIMQLIDAFKKGIRTKYDLADYLNVTERYLEYAIQYYKRKYGLYFVVDNYVICFEPSLQIVELFDTF
jgi:Zn-dependent peptidase ImmA (M78 family)